MQRLAEIDIRRRDLLAELDALNHEETEIKRALAQAASIDPAIVAFVQRSVTQQGCADAQARLDVASPEERAFMFSAALGDLRNLLTQTYGALFLQKLLELAPPSELGRFMYALNVGTTLVDVSSSPSGARVVQRFMELLNTSAEAAMQFTHIIATHLVPLANDTHGSHIVQRALTSRFAGDKTILVDELIARCVEIATNKQGCCVLQRAIDWLPDAARERVISAVIHNELELVQDAFGNYVVQHFGPEG
jgi:hypothetical protein